MTPASKSRSGTVLVAPFPPQPPKLLDQLRQTARDGGHSEATAEAFVGWSRRFILFHGTRHPKERGLGDVGRFLDHVVRTEKAPCPRSSQPGRPW
jgi:hypothetical protein